MSLKMKVSIAVGILIAIGILPFTGGMWSGIWTALSEPSQHICIKSHSEEHMEYVYTGSDAKGNPRYMWMMQTSSVCDKEAINPEWVKWKKEHANH